MVVTAFALSLSASLKRALTTGLTLICYSICLAYYCASAGTLGNVGCDLEEFSFVLPLNVYLLHVFNCLFSYMFSLSYY